MNLQNALLPRRQTCIGDVWRDADRQTTLTVRNPYDGGTVVVKPSALTPSAALAWLGIHTH